MNGWSWRERLAEICLLGGTGALWGASSALVLGLLGHRVEGAVVRERLVPDGARGAAVMLAAVLAISLAVPTFAVVFNPRTARATYNLLSKAISSAPANDLSEGDAILRFSHTAEVRPDRYPAPTFSHDGASFVAVAADRRLVRVETATGKTLGTIGEPLPRLVGFAVAWSADGRLLATRTAGEKLTTNSRYAGTRARFRVYTLSDYRVAGDYTHREDECFASVYAYPGMMFEPDGASLWVVCGQRDRPEANDLMALRLEIPSLRVLESRYYGDLAPTGEVRGLALTGDAVWSWQHGTGDADEVRVRDLTHDREVAHLRDLSQPRFADGLAQQRYDQLIEGRITLRYAGETSEGRLVTRRLVFDPRSGDLVERRDEPRSPNAPQRTTFELSEDLRLETAWRIDSKAGEIDVIDNASGVRRQHILTHAYWPGEISPDGRWLVMNAIEVPALRIYRVTP